MARSSGSERLIKLGDRLRLIREAQTDKLGRKVYQRDAARIAGIDESRYRNWEYGRSQMPEEVAKSLAAEWGIKWTDFYVVDGKVSYAGAEVSPPMVPIPTLNIPIPYVGNVGANSKAEWFDPVDTGDSIDVPNEMATPTGPDSMRFACTVVGDSCYDLLWPGDTAVFHKSNVPRLGLIMLFRSFDNTVTIKQIKHDGRNFFLHPLNPAYEDAPAEGTVVGYLVGIVRMSGSKKVTVYDAHGITP